MRDKLKQHPAIERYLTTVCTRIKCKEVHSEVRLELASHIVEVADALVAAGESEDTAVAKALTQMGDPNVVGESLHKAHRPRIEWGLLATLGGLLLAALITMQSLAGIDSAAFGHLGWHTALAALVGGGLAAVCYFADYRKLTRLAPIILAGTALVLVLANRLSTNLPAIGRLSGIGPYILVVAVAGTIHRLDFSNSRGLLYLAGLVALPWALGLPIMQHLVYLISLVAMLAQAKLDRKKVAAATALAAVSLLLIALVLPVDATSRLSVVLNPGADPHGSGYVHQRLLEAVQLGGPFGVRDATLPPGLPEVHTDFIFAYLVYRFGWVTGLSLVLLTALLLLRMVFASRAIKDTFGKTIIAGLYSVLAVQLVWNCLMSIGRFPVAGLTFPFISYGRALLIVQMCAVGLVLGIFRRKDSIASSLRMKRA